MAGRTLLTNRRRRNEGMLEALRRLCTEWEGFALREAAPPATDVALGPEKHSGKESLDAWIEPGVGLVVLKRL